MKKPDIQISLRNAASLIAALFSVPAIGMLIYVNLSHQKWYLQERKVKFRQVAELISDGHEEQIENARETLNTLQYIPAFFSNETSQASMILRSIHTKTKSYSALNMFDQRGKQIASSDAMPRAYSVHDRQWFQDVISKKEFIIGEYVVGRSSGIPILVVATPLFRSDGTLHRVIAAGIQVSDFTKIMKNDVHTKRPRTILVDRFGTVVLDSKNPRQSAKKSSPMRLPSLRTRKKNITMFRLRIQMA